MLSRIQKLAYVLPALFLTVVAFPLHVFVPRLYTDSLGVSADLVGAVLIATALFDAVSDPVMGGLTDRTRGRFGKRRGYIALGGLILAVAFALLLAPPNGASALYLTLSLFAVYLGWTVVVIPYEALAIDVTRTYDERTRLLGTRETFALFGLAFAIVAPVGLVELGLVDDERGGLAVLAYAIAPLLVLSCLWCAWIVREPVRVRKTGAERFVVVRAMLQNRPFLVLLLSFTLTTVAGSLPSSMMLYFAEHVLGAEQPGYFLLLWVAAAVVFAPAWIVFAEKTEKRTAYVVAIALIGLAHGAMFFLQEGQLLAYGVLAVVAGVPFAGLLLLPSAMQADAVDLGIELSGQHDEGFYVGAWNLARKVPAAVATGSALTVLGWSGYLAGQPQDENVLFTLRILYSVVPTVIFAFALVVALAYPIDRARHAEIRAGLGV